MQRRRFLSAIGSVIAWPLAASAQQRTIPRVGVLVAESASHPSTEAFRTGMRELGYVEGRTVAIDWRYADALFARAIALATELVRLKVDVIAAHHTPAVKASMSVTSTIPIVMAPAGAPVQAGLIKSLAQPGGNVTGLSSMEAELGTKRLQLLVDMIPGLKRVAVLGARTDPFTRPYVQDFQDAAARLGLRLQPVLVDGPREFEGAFSEMQGGCAGCGDPTPVPATDEQDRGARGQASHRDHVELPGHDAGRRPDLVLGGPCRVLPARGDLRRQDPQGRKALELPRRATGEVRAGRQSEDREGSRPQPPSIDPGRSGRDRSVS